MPKQIASHTVLTNKPYALRNGEVEMFIPNLKARANTKVLRKRKLIKKDPRVYIQAKTIVNSDSKPVDIPKQAEKKDIPKQAEKKVVAKKVEKKVIKLKKPKKVAKKQTKTQSSLSKKKSSSKTIKYAKGIRTSLRLKNYKRVSNLKGELIQTERLRLSSKSKKKSQKGLSKSKEKKQRMPKQGQPQPANKKGQKEGGKQTNPRSSKRDKLSRQNLMTRLLTRKKASNSLSVPKIKIIPVKPNKITETNPPLSSQLSNSIVSSQSSIANSNPPQENRLKSIAELQRIHRSRHQRIFLLKAQRKEEGWTFHVIGTTGRIYTTKVSTSVTCTCFDFRSKRKPCKHIYFIVTQIAQNEKILQGFTDKAKIPEAAFNELNQNLYKRLKARIEGKKQSEENKEIDLKDDKDCIICFTQMDQSEETLEDCNTCKKYFHGSCIKKWRMHNNSCPLCRSVFASPEGELDPLQKFQDLKI